MKFNAKKLLVTSLAVALVSAVSVAGTLALRASGERQAEPPLVQIIGTPLTGSIVPGTTQPYNGKVVLQKGDAGYVFLEVTDNTDKLVGYELDGSWQRMEGVDGLFYQQVTAREAEQELNILKNPEVSYSAALNNQDMVDENGNLKQGLALSFKAYAVLQTDITLEDAEKLVPREISTGREFSQAVTDGRSVRLTQDIQLPWNVTIRKPMVIDLNGKAISNPADRPYTLQIEDAEVKIRNGIIRSGYTTAVVDGVEKQWSGYALYLKQGADVTLDDCTIEVSGPERYEPYAIYVNKPAEGKAEPKLLMRNSTIETTNPDSIYQGKEGDTGAGGFAAYIRAGTVKLENCTVNGWVCIRGGDVTLDGGTYSARRFEGQGRAWLDKAEAGRYVSGTANGSAFTTGDCISIADGCEGYNLTKVTIKNIHFDNTITVLNTDTTSVHKFWPVTVCAIKYVNVSNDATPATLDISGNTYSNLLEDGSKPVMFIDSSGSDVAYAPANP